MPAKGGATALKTSLGAAKPLRTQTAIVVNQDKPTECLALRNVTGSEQGTLISGCQDNLAKIAETL
jgi:hypothetical protein